MKKWLQYLSISIVGIGLFSLLSVQFATHTSTVAMEPESTIIYPAQYSDTHITKNAIVTDQRFKDLATFKKESFLASVISSFGASAPAPAAGAPEKGTWLWTPTLDLTPGYWNTIIAAAKKDGIRAIYLSIDSYLDIFVLPDGPEKTAKKKTFDNIIERFITAAHKNGMAVDAEAGWRNWAEPGNEYKASAVVDYVLRFNATHEEKFRGFQYDVEPYLLSSYVTDKKTVLRDFVTLVNKTVTQLDGSDVAFSVVIPDFYDGTRGETPRFLYGWNYGHTLSHLLKVLERRPGSTLLVMAYRNKSEGTDGSIDISRDEIQMADGYHTKVVIAQETGDVPPPSITFYNTSRSSLNAELQNIQNAFAGNESYNGIAIHYINALMELD